MEQQSFRIQNYRARTFERGRFVERVRRRRAPHANARAHVNVASRADDDNDCFGQNNAATSQSLRARRDAHIHFRRCFG